MTPSATPANLQTVPGKLRPKPLEAPPKARPPAGLPHARRHPLTGTPNPDGFAADLHHQGRIRVLADIALRYHELVQPGIREGLQADGNYVPLMPRTYTTTVREFERLMAWMRNQGRQQAHRGQAVATLRWHICHWYIDAQRVIRRYPIPALDKRGRPILDKRGQPKVLRDGYGRVTTRPVIVHRRHPDARKPKADWGLEWLAGQWGLATEPMRPENPASGQQRNAA